MQFDTTAILLVVSTTYLGISIIIEILHIMFLFTPSKRDDAWIEKVKEKWSHASSYLSWLSVRTPASVALNKALGMLGQARDDIAKKKGAKKK